MFRVYRHADTLEAPQALLAAYTSPTPSQPPSMPLSAAEPLSVPLARYT